MSAYRKVTLQDVAKAANVSYATVSAVLNGKDGISIRVSDTTKNTVLECAERLGYVPNLAARELKNGKNSLISVFTYENIFPVESRNEFYDFFVGIQEEAAKNGFDLLILNNRLSHAGKSSRITLAAGAVMIGLNRDDEDIASLAKRHFPLVFVGRRSIPGVHTEWVTFDYYSVIKDMLAHLATRHPKGLVLVSQRGVHTEPSVDKHDFLLELAAEFGFKVSCEYIDDAADIPSDLVDVVSDHGSVVLDRLAFIDAFERQCTDRGVVIGRDFLGAVLEDDWVGRYGHWTRWTNRRRELGSLAVRHLSHIIHEKSTESLERLVPLELIPSDSSR